MMGRGDTPKPKRRSRTERRVQATQDVPYVPQVTLAPEVDEDAFDQDGLTVRQRLLCEYLIGPAGGNQTKAAEMAGYRSENINSLRATASATLTNPNVQQYLSRLFAKRRLSREWIEAGLTDLAHSHMANFLSEDEKGNWKLDLSKAALYGALGQIKEYKEEVMTTGAGENIAVIKRTIKLHDRGANLERVARLQGLMVDKHEHNVPKDLRDLLFETDGAIEKALPDGVVPPMPADSLAKPDIRGGPGGGKDTGLAQPGTRPRPA